MTQQINNNFFKPVWGLIMLYYSKSQCLYSYYNHPLSVLLFVLKLIYMNDNFFIVYKQLEK